jgi:hypothetical protein
MPFSASAFLALETHIGEPSSFQGISHANKKN